MDDEHISYDLFSSSLRLIAGANMASQKEINDTIKDLEEMIDTDYYDDADGNVLMQQIVVYLKKKKDS